MSVYTKYFNLVSTPQTEPIPGKAQIKNNAGGYGFGVDIWERLNRFLILGTDGGTYYVSEKELTLESCQVLLTCLQSDGEKVVSMIVEISTSGRAPKNSPAIFALAVSSKLGDLKTRQYAYKNLLRVCRTSTHLFEYCSYIKTLGGFGSGTRKAISRWYLERPESQLAYQLVKYQSRGGWSHRDVLRLAHPKPKTAKQGDMLGWATGKNKHGAGVLITAFELAKVATKEKIGQLLGLGLTWEMLPTKMLSYPEVWREIIYLDNLPYTAMIRNLGRLSSIGLLDSFSNPGVTSLLCSRLTDTERIKNSRIHPLSLLQALKIYSSGGGKKGKLTWKVDGEVLDSLNQAIFSSFSFLEKTDKRLLVALDVSGSMSLGKCAGMNYLTPREGTCAVAMSLFRSNPRTTVLAFSNGLIELGISRNERLDSLINKTEKLPFMGTDCSLPMLEAISRGYEVDAFVILTDNETWAGKMHPCQALNKYRKLSGIHSKLIVLAATPTMFSIADPLDVNTLDIVGLDSSVPTLISDFIQK